MDFKKLNQLYGFGHDAQSAQIIREALTTFLRNDIKHHKLNIKVKLDHSGYGGPDVLITTTDQTIAQTVRYILKDGSIGHALRAEFKKTAEMMDYQIEEPEELKKLNAKIKDFLSNFGHNYDDAQTDYFDNTQPMFYGVEFKK